MVKILKFPNRNSPASKEKMEELLIANEEFNKKEDEFDKALFDLFKKYKKISKYLKSTKKENNELIKNMIENKSSNHKSNDGPMPHTELEKFKTQFMQNPYQPPK